MRSIIKNVICLTLTFTVLPAIGRATPTRDERKAEARQLMEFVGNIYDRLPTPAPAVVEYVQSEEKAIEAIGDLAVRGQRLVSLLATKECTLVRAKEQMRNLKDALGLILNEKVTLRREVEAWLFVGAELANDFGFRDQVGSLVKFGLLKKEELALLELDQGINVHVKGIRALRQFGLPLYRALDAESSH